MNDLDNITKSDNIKPKEPKDWREWLIRNRRTICGFLIILILFELVGVLIMYTNYKENYLGNEDAIRIICEDIPCSEADIENFESDLETDDGNAWIEAEFTYKGQNYTYLINAETGTIDEKTVK